jgi:hypothetical protein
METKEEIPKQKDFKKITYEFSDQELQEIYRKNEEKINDIISEEIPKHRELYEADYTGIFDHNENTFLLIKAIVNYLLKNPDALLAFRSGNKRQVFQKAKMEQLAKKAFKCSYRSLSYAIYGGKSKNTFLHGRQDLILKVIDRIKEEIVSEELRIKQEFGITTEEEEEIIKYENMDQFFQSQQIRPLWINKWNAKVGRYGNKGGLVEKVNEKTGEIEFDKDDEPIMRKVREKYGIMGKQIFNYYLYCQRPIFDWKWDEGEKSVKEFLDRYQEGYRIRMKKGKIIESKTDKVKKATIYALQNAISYVIQWIVSFPRFKKQWSEICKEKGIENEFPTLTDTQAYFLNDIVYNTTFDLSGTNQYMNKPSKEVQGALEAEYL